MTVSSIGATALRIYPQHTNPTSIAGPGFAQSLAVAAGPDAGTSISSGATPGAGTSVAELTPDFTNMTPRKLYAQSQELFKAGKIGLDDSFRMQMLAGGLDPNAPAYTSDTPVNYVNLYKSQLAGIVSRGGKGEAGYESYIAILNAIGPSERGGVG